MSVLFSKQGDVLIAIPNGRLDTNNSPEAEKAISENIENGDTKIIIDFSKTDYISSAGLRVILITAKQLRQKSGTIVLCNANEQIHEVLEISGFLSLVKCVATLDDALSEIAA